MQQNPRHFVTYTIEHSPFQKWVVFVAAVGFLSDAYDIFALNVVSQIVPWIYWSQNGNPGTQYQAALLCSTLVGSFIGQVVFGFLGDLYGRRKMYGLELIILIVGSIGTAMASEGSNQSMSIIGWLTFWRIFMGVGIGSDYPIVSPFLVTMMGKSAHNPAERCNYRRICAPQPSRSHARFRVLDAGHRSGSSICHCSCCDCCVEANA